MPYFPKAEAPNVQPYWCHNCAVWYLPQSGVVQTSCCVLHPPGSCCHMGETRLVAEGSQPQPAVVAWPSTTGSPTVYPWGSVTISAGDLVPYNTTTATLVAWGQSMIGGDTSHMVDS